MLANYEFCASLNDIFDILTPLRKAISSFNCFYAVVLLISQKSGFSLQMSFGSLHKCVCFTVLCVCDDMSSSCVIIAMQHSVTVLCQLQCSTTLRNLFNHHETILVLASLLFIVFYICLAMPLHHNLQLEDSYEIYFIYNISIDIVWN